MFSTRVRLTDFAEEALLLAAVPVSPVVHIVVVAFESRTETGPTGLTGTPEVLRYLSACTNLFAIGLHGLIILQLNKLFLHMEKKYNYCKSLMYPTCGGIRVEYNKMCCILILLDSNKSNLIIVLCQQSSQERASLDMC